MEEGVPEAEKVMRPKEVVEKNKDKQEPEEEEEKGANKGGIFNNLISNFMDATTTTTTTEEGKSGENIQNFECKDENDKEKESSSVGVLEKIISHLPEDAAPTTEEAAILIHSAID